MTALRLCHKRTHGGRANLNRGGIDLNVKIDDEAEPFFIFTLRMDTLRLRAS